MDTKLKYASEDEIIKKINILRNGFRSKKTLDISNRKRELLKLKSALKLTLKEHIDSLKIDMGMSETFAHYSSYSVVLNDLDYIISNFESWAKPQSQDSPLLFAPASSYLVHEPLGVSLIFSAWNSQYITLIMPLAASIAAGNTTLLKPSEMSPNTCLVIEKIVKELDPDFVQLIQGDYIACEILLKHKFDLIVFTGSGIKGKLVAKAAAEFLTPCVLELGGQNPTVVSESCDFNCATTNIINGRFSMAGQICIAPEYLLVHKSIKEKFVKRLKEKLIDFYGQNPRESNDYSRIINKFHTERIKKIIDSTTNGTKIVGGNSVIEEKYVEPSIFEFDSISELSKSALFKDEIFGPILYIAPFNDFNEVIDLINSKDKPLAMYYFGSNKKEISRLEKETSSGALTINDCLVHVTSPFLPFGGVGGSGYSSYHGKFGFDNFSHIKPVLKRVAQTMPLRYPPFTGSKGKIFIFTLEKLTWSQSQLLKAISFGILLILAYYYRNTLKSFY